MNLLVIRHAQPLDEAGTDGQGDPPLSDLGHRQAVAIADFLADENVDHIVSSPMVRAHETAMPLAERLELEPELDDDLKEAGWEAGAYMRTEENLQHFIDALAENPDFLYEPEGRDAFEARVLSAFSRVVEGHPGRTVAVFCHGMVTATIAGHSLGIRPSADTLQPHYSALTRIQASASNGMWSLRSFNESMHLPR